MSTDTTTETDELLPKSQWPESVPDPTVACRRCGNRRPVGQPCIVCRDAQHAMMSLKAADRKATRRTQACTEMVERIVQVSQRDGSSAAIVPIVEDLIQLYGGSHDVAALWKGVIDRAVESKSVMAGLKAMSDLAKVLIAIAPKIERRVDLKSLTDEQLEEEYRSTVFREAMLKLATEEPGASPYVERFLARAEGLAPTPDESPSGDEAARTDGDD